MDQRLVRLGHIITGVMAIGIVLIGLCGSVYVFTRVVIEPMMQANQTHNAIIASDRDLTQKALEARIILCAGYKDWKVQHANSVQKMEDICQ